MVSREQDIADAWHQMNDLLGQKVIGLNTLKCDSSQVSSFGQELYLMTPPEVEQYAGPQQLGPGYFAHLDPTRDEALDVLLHGSRTALGFLEHSSIQPWYWLATSVTSQEGTQVVIHQASLAPYFSTTPMHHFGSSEDIPVIHYDYRLHSGSKSYRPSGDHDPLLIRLREAEVQGIDISSFM